MEVLRFKREYDVEGLQEKVILHIDEPRAEYGAWACEYLLIGPGAEQEIRRLIRGVDKLQSLTSAFRHIVKDLDTIAADLGRRITWLGEPRLDLI